MASANQSPNSSALRSADSAVERLIQFELNFQAQPGSGLDAWHAEQQRQRELLARELRLPLGKEVEVWLHGGVRLRGKLQVDEVVLVHVQATLENTRFQVTGVPFTYAEIESCVAL